MKIKTFHLLGTLFASLITVLTAKNHQEDLNVFARLPGVIAGVLCLGMVGVANAVPILDTASLPDGGFLTLVDFPPLFEYWIAEDSK